MITAVVVPLLLLAGAEAILRLANYGYPTSFFLEREQAGQHVLIENDKFGWRFFPRAAARSPSSMTMKAVKPPGSYRIFIFGESAALGDPRPAYGVGRYLEALLRERFPGTDFEIVCVAMTAINSHAILPIARECARHDGDLWIIYMGNNEMEGPFGANTIFGPRAPQLGVIRATLALRATKIGQLLESLAARVKGDSPARSSWEGMKMFLDQQLPPDDPRKQIVYSHFRRNLEGIIQRGLRSGAKPILCTVPSNLKDCAPFASLHRRELNEKDRKQWETSYQRAQDLISTNEFRDARQLLKEAARLDAQFAELHFRAGQCAWNSTNYHEARTSFELARDEDALPFRTDGTLNRIIKEVAGRFAAQGLQLLDAEEQLARGENPGDIAGEEFFYDHVHLTFDGNYRLARLLAEQVEKKLPISITQRGKAKWASAEICERRLGLTDWNRSAVYQNMLQRLFDAPFTNQLNHAARAQALVEKIRKIRAQMQSDLIPDARAIYEKAIAQNPDDYRLSENFAEFLEAIGDVENAVAQWQRVMKLIPHHQTAYFHAGRLLSRQRKYAEAKEYLNKTLSLRPDFADARLEFGQISLNEEKPEEALQEFFAARNLRSEDPRVHFQIASAYVALNKREEAVASLREAIRLRPKYWEARYLLGVQLAAHAEFAEAQAQFEEVTRLRPDYASAHFNLGVALAKQNHIEPAMAEFRETLRLDPQHDRAGQYLQALQAMTKPH